MKKKIIYFNDELNDDFAGTNINQKVIDKKYKYIHKNKCYLFFEFIIFYIIVFPIIWLHEKILYGAKYINKRALRKFKSESIFLYGNHVGSFDGFTSSIISGKKRNRIISNPDAVSIKGLGWLMPMLGVIPLPSDTSAAKNYMRALKHHIDKKENITIFPEAHIWPYYTKIRPFNEQSFIYPVQYNKPVIAFCTTFHKTKGIARIFRKVNIRVYISDPIYPNASLSRNEAKKYLKDKVYSFMVSSSKNNTYEHIIYIKNKKGI